MSLRITPLPPWPVWTTPPRLPCVAGVPQRQSTDSTAIALVPVPAAAQPRRPGRTGCRCSPQPLTLTIRVSWLTQPAAIRVLGFAERDLEPVLGSTPPKAPKCVISSPRHYGAGCCQRQRRLPSPRNSLVPAAQRPGRTPSDGSFLTTTSAQSIGDTRRPGTASVDPP